MAIRKGASAIGKLNEQADGGGGSHEITPLKSGTTIKVRVKSAEDVASYHAYGIFKKVYTFVPKNPAERNERGFITGNPTPWDKASQYYQDLAKEADKRGDSTEAEEMKALARDFRGKERFLMGFHDLSQGKDIIVDLTKNQAQGVYAAIQEYEEDLEDMAFKLAKTGQSTSTTVTLSPIVNLAKGLTDEERKNFDESAGKPFNEEMFDSVLYEADEAEQIENLGKAGFDVSLIGLSESNEKSEKKTEETKSPEEAF